MKKNENTIHANMTVRYKGVKYKTGNRGHGLVELYDFIGNFVKTVSFSEIRVVSKPVKP